ncbi:MAG: 50S ribosomal protein L23 [Acidobacteriaceae bacterium]|nr:50S ribosomal protein L23 [Acidobacteriaceae bacterium]
MPTVYSVIRRPIITEKALVTRESEGSLVFEVAPNATKTEVKQAVEKLFNVKVASIRTANVEGKERRRGRFSGYLPDWKKAYVKLKKGETVPDFTGEL